MEAVGWANLPGSILTGNFRGQAEPSIGCRGMALRTFDDELADGWW